MLNYLHDLVNLELFYFCNIL